MRILLIGGKGFIGQQVSHRLIARGHDLIMLHPDGPDNPTLGDIIHIPGSRLTIDQHRESIRDARPDAVVDFLPWGEADTRRIISTLNGIVEHAVHLSSADVYRAWEVFFRGGRPEPVPLDENAPLREGLYPYAVKHPGMVDYDKVAAERAVLAAHFEQGYSAMILRLPVVYGPGDQSLRLLPFIRRMVDGRARILLGAAQAGWLCHRAYVDDVAYAVALAVENPDQGTIYNVGEPQVMTMAGWVGAMGDAIGWGGDVIAVPDATLPENQRPRHNHTQHIILDTTNIRRDLGYDELHDRTGALRHTIEWTLSNAPSPGEAARREYEEEDRAFVALQQA